MLRELGRILIRKQSLFLEQKGPLNPFTVKELAEELNVHESTISRALSSKYASTPRGILPLRSLVALDPATQNAREILEALVDSEDKQTPLTDEELAKELGLKGHRVARRTIAKYRAQLKIGPSPQRKHH